MRGRRENGAHFFCSAHRNCAACRHLRNRTTIEDNGCKESPCPRSALVGNDAQWPPALLPVPASLPHWRRPARLLLHPQERRRTPASAWLWSARGRGDGSGREEAAEPLFPRHENIVHGNGRLQYGLLLLPELGYLEGQGGPGERRGSFSQERSEARAALRCAPLGLHL